MQTGKARTYAARRGTRPPRVGSGSEPPPSVILPLRTAATTAPLRRATHLTVLGGDRSSIWPRQPTRRPPPRRRGSEPVVRVGTGENRLAGGGRRIRTLGPSRKGSAGKVEHLDEVGPFFRGTEGSNPSSSTGESNSRTLNFATTGRVRQRRWHRRFLPCSAIRPGLSHQR